MGNLRLFVGRRASWLRTLVLVPILVALLPASTVNAQAAVPQFTQISHGGFGDYRNSFSWSMQWFNGKLYVGTNREFACVEQETLAFYKLAPYETNPGLLETCPADPTDLSLQAEIWQYTPGAATPWVRVYQSPATIPNPNAPGKFVANDIGYRNMIVMSDPTNNNTPTLFVAGATASEYLPGIPGPDLLRSTDGVNFTTIPSGATTINDWNKDNDHIVSYRAMAVYNNNLYVTASPDLIGDGVLMQVQNPFATNVNDVHFVQLSPNDTHVYELNTFTDSQGLKLYLGNGDVHNGFSVVKTDATGSPFTFTPVVTGGGGRGATMQSVVSMHVFNGKLYVGTGDEIANNALPACEIIRINPDDTWDIVVGSATAQKTPISNIGDDFNNFFDIHIWRMEDYNGMLYVGTNDVSVFFWYLAVIFPSLWNEFGADLWSTQDGVTWTPVTRNGFGDPLNFGIRTMASTPVGLFVGTANDAFGTEVYLSSAAGAVTRAAASQVHTTAPSVISRAVAGRASAGQAHNAAPSSGSRVAAGQAHNAATSSNPAPATAGSPSGLQVQHGSNGAVLTWNAVSGAAGYNIYRMTVDPTQLARLPHTLDPSVVTKANELGGHFTLVGTSSQATFTDSSAAPTGLYVYYVQANDQQGHLSSPSNMATAR